MEPEGQEKSEARAGRCAIFGRPNVGKSTFLNQVLGQKLVIATARPGTTRSAVLGVYLKEDPPTQIAFVDSPGVARPRTPLHKVLVEQAQQALTDTDVVLWMTEAPKPVRKKGGKASVRTDVHPTDREIVRYLEAVKQVTPEDFRRVAKEYLHDDNRTLYALLPEGLDAGLIGRRIGDLGLPEDAEVAAVTRFGVAVTVDDDLVLEADDQVTLVGPEESMPAPGEPAPLG